MRAAETYCKLHTDKRQRDGNKTNGRRTIKNKEKTTRPNKKKPSPHLSTSRSTRVMRPP